MAFHHWNMSNSKPPKISRTLLSIRDDFSNALVLVISIRPLISNASSTLSKLWGPLQTQYLQLVSPVCSYSTAILVLRQGPSTCFFFHFLWFSLGGLLVRKNLWDGKLSFFFVNYHLAWFSDRGGVIFVSQNPKEFYVSIGEILICAYTICLSGQISISCTIFCGSTFPPSRF